MSDEVGKLEGADRLEEIRKEQSNDRIETNPETGRKENWTQERRIRDYYLRKKAYMEKRIYY